jgi:hypothetical protein
LSFLDRIIFNFSHITLRISYPVIVNLKIVSPSYDTFLNNFYLEKNGIIFLWHATWCITCCCFHINSLSTDSKVKRNIIYGFWVALQCKSIHNQWSSECNIIFFWIQDWTKNCTHWMHEREWQMKYKKKTPHSTSTKLWQVLKLWFSIAQKYETLDPVVPVFYSLYSLFLSTNRIHYSRRKNIITMRDRWVEWKIKKGNSTQQLGEV